MKHWLKNIDDIIATIAVIGVISLTILNVVSRYALNHPIQWAEELAIALFIWFIFIGVSSSMKRDGHVGVDYFVRKLPRPLKILSEIIRAGAIYFVLIYVFIYLGSKLAAQASDKITPILGISYEVIDIAVPLGGLLTLIHFTSQLVSKYRREYCANKEV
ncbi:TRAP transporter small permease [Paenalcaligenes niemegkensis]|uniref:TRAP transporter small permease n=1 Tax=Paenalcaligenes niemegkensis TaxID=2895469 RepID=UPI001EE9A87D|nr:TRAP transporter small permease [Paenalcaligenes niemegkensis]MCQ9618103.1 TRAP transporter small permease [Paenalcaligenes niemegkensis]